MRKGMSVLLAVVIALLGIVLTAPAASASGATIVATYHDADGRTVIYRSGTYNGSTGFGWQKVYQRHNIGSYNAIGFIAHNPDGGVPQGSDRVYMAYANKLLCNATHTDCDVVDSLPVKLVVNYAKVSTYYGVTINGVLGVKTAYCINDDGALKCPDWVSPALKASFRTVSGGRVETTKWSYSPLRHA